MSFKDLKIEKQSDMTKTINRLRFALLRYGGHIEPCPGRPCECGFLDEWQFAELPATLGDAVDIYKLPPLVKDDPGCRCVRVDGTTRFNINCPIHGKAP